MAVEVLRDLFADLALPASYEDAGIEFVLEPELIDSVWPQSCTRTNPRTPTEEELRRLFLALDRPPHRKA